MAVLDKETFMTRIREYFGDAPDDASLSVMEDIIDTYNDREQRSGEDEWKRRYDELDRTWRQRYTERFFTPIPDSSTDDESYLYDRSNEDVSIEEQSPDDSLNTYDDLFS